MTALAILLALLLAGLALYAGRLIISINELAAFVKELASGNLNARLFSTRSRRLNAVARDMVAVMERIRERLDYAEQERQRVEAILRGLSDGVLITDSQGVILLANDAFRRLLAAGEQIEGRQTAEVLRNAELLEMMQAAGAAWDMVSGEIVVSRTGRDKHLIATAVPIIADTTVSGVVLTLHDITRLKQLEEMRKDFVANVSHEIKTPLTAITGFTETLLDGAIDDRDCAVRFLSMIKNHSERLTSLVNDLLTLSRIELGDAPVVATDVHLDEIIDTVFLTLKHRADRKGLVLKKTLPEGAPVIVADRDKLIQIVLNLVDNGIKFTESGSVTVGLDDVDGTATLYVQDTGIGIPQKHIHRLGERFYRVDSARSRELGGTGLGLAIVKHLVSAHGWPLRIESYPGRGTRVNIILTREKLPG